MVHDCLLQDSCLVGLRRFSTDVAAHVFAGGAWSFSGVLGELYHGEHAAITPVVHEAAVWMACCIMLRFDVAEDAITC